MTNPLALDKNTQINNKVSFKDYVSRIFKGAKRERGSPDPEVNSDESIAIDARMMQLPRVDPSTSEPMPRYHNMKNIFLKRDGDPQRNGLSRRCKIIIIVLVIMSITFIILLTLALTVFKHGGSSVAAIPIQIDLSASPAELSNPISNSFVGLGVETWSFPQYAGNTSSPNIFSQNLIQSIVEKQGGKVGFRVGGTSGDHALYLPHQAEAVIEPDSQFGKNVPSNLTIGPAWFDSFATLSGLVDWTFQVPLATLDINTALAESEAALAQIGIDNLFALEIGNEPNFYPGNDRPASYSPSDYVSEWLEWADSLAGNISLPGKQEFQAMALSSKAATPWTVPNIFASGIDASLIKSVSTHYYQANARGATIAGDFLNHTALTTKLASTISEVQWLSENHPDIQFVLGEVGSGLNVSPANGPTQNNYALQEVLGASLWNLNFMLYAMAKNISKVNMQQGLGFGYAAWTPTLVPATGDQPHVSGPYYALVMAADFIGNSTNLRTATVFERANFTAYAGYEDGQLSKLALVNLHQWNSTQNNNRPSQKVVITLPGFNTVRVDRLTGPGADASANITWANDLWSYESSGKAVRIESTAETVSSINGQLTVTVSASEAALLTLI